MRNCKTFSNFETSNKQNWTQNGANSEEVLGYVIIILTTTLNMKKVDISETHYLSWWGVCI